MTLQLYHHYKVFKSEKTKSCCLVINQLVVLVQKMEINKICIYIFKW